MLDFNLSQTIMAGTKLSTRNDQRQFCPTGDNFVLPKKIVSLRMQHICFWCAVSFCIQHSSARQSFTLHKQTYTLYGTRNWSFRAPVLYPIQVETYMMAGLLTMNEKMRPL